MEQKTYRIVKNMLLPFKTTIIIDEDFLQVGKKKVNWKDVKACSCHVQSINGAMNYIVALDGVNGEKVQLNIVHNIAASKKKKDMFAEIYNTTVSQLEKHHIIPKAQDILKDIEKGNEVTLAKAVFSNKGVEILKGMMKKEKIFLPMEEVDIQFLDGSGGFDICSKNNRKTHQFIQLANPDSRYILEVMSKLVTPSEKKVADTAPDLPS